MNIRKLKFLVRFLLLAAVVQPVFSQCGITAGPVEKALDWDAAFTQNGPGQDPKPAGSAGWTGGDSSNSNLPFEALPGDSLYVDFYRPRFVRVRVQGLK